LNDQLCMERVLKKLAKKEWHQVAQVHAVATGTSASVEVKRTVVFKIIQNQFKVAVAYDKVTVTWWNRHTGKSLKAGQCFVAHGCAPKLFHELIVVVDDAYIKRRNMVTLHLNLKLKISN
jgi:predicted secreted Zn-dependent protease